MCGIVGYIGKREAAPLLFEGLRRLEYRGYDSAGIVTLDSTGEIHLERALGKLENLLKGEDLLSHLPGTLGIGHTRWATHGPAILENAHPHFSDGMRVVLVHNGIIENYLEIRKYLADLGYSFYGETDSEVLAKLIDHEAKGCGEYGLKALKNALSKVRGSYALAILFKEDPTRIYATRKDSPLLLAKGKEGYFLASDAPALSGEAKSLIYLENHEFAVLGEDGIKVYSKDLSPLTKEEKPMPSDWKESALGEYADFMSKEMAEEPLAIRRTFHSAFLNREPSLLTFGLKEKDVQEIESLLIVGCGSAYHVGLSGSYLFEKFARLSARVELASEFRYRDPVLSNKSLVILISQSGETADTLSALRLAKKKGARTLAIVNVEGSSIARESDSVFYTQAGPEIAVATTKAYSAQLLSLELLSLLFGKARGTLERQSFLDYLQVLRTLSEEVQKVLENEEAVASFAKGIYEANHLFYIGRLFDYPSALEGSLKLKEISYLHSEAYAAGELKHGTISLIEKGTPVIGLLTDPHVFEKTLSNLIETKARGAKIYVISSFPEERFKGMLDGYLPLPELPPEFMPSLNVVVLQLIAYHVARLRGLDVDKPRNLAKSVTVE